MGNIGKRIGFFVCICCLFLAFPIVAKAGSGVVQFSTKTEQVKKGDAVTIICQVTATEEFLDTSFNINYDADVLHFVKGGKKVSGGDGKLTVLSVGNTEATTKKTFSLQFIAAKKGYAFVSVEGTAKVTDAEGNDFSISSNRLMVNVSKKGAVKEEPKETVAPVATPEPVFSDNNKLKSLETSALSFSPEFTPEGEAYTAQVSSDTNTLYVTFETEDEKARVRLIGNKDLKTGSNYAKVVVTAENGSQREYQITITKETEAQTKEREEREEKIVKDVEFGLTQNGDRKILKNSYEFEVLDPSGLEQIPAGYIQSNVEFNGITVPAFTMEQDLENNYLLLYLKGPAGENTLYQFDREEKTLQRYTGTMIDKINKGEGSKRNIGSGLSVSNFVLLGFIVALVIMCLLITMIKMTMKMKQKEEKKDGDDLDF